MGLKFLLQHLYILSYFCDIVHCLTCLSCNTIIQPRHCHEVAVCDPDEVCGAERLPSSMGFQAYQLGCVSKSTCSNGTTPNRLLCKQCCDGDLCNSALCKEPDYPATRGPICYDCQYHTHQHPCRRIQFCSADEDCSVHVTSEFGDTILTSGCQQKHACMLPSNLTPPPIVGKRAVNTTTPPSSLSLCNSCCSQDLCNLNCSTTDHCATSSCKHGTCVSTNSTATCVCSQGWRGQRCDQFDHCTSSPCQHGNCSLTMTGYRCTCEFGWTGTNCEVSTFTAYDCDFEKDLCNWIQSGTDNFDWTRNSGATGSTSTGPNGDHTTGSGYYMYIEASNVQTGYKADLVSQLLPAGLPGQTYCFSLALNMYGNAMGSIDIYIEPERKTKFLIQHFKQISNTPTWHERNISIPTQFRNFSIVIEGLRGTDYESDAAIDDLHLSPGSC